MANNRELSQFANVVGYNGGNIGINTDNPSNLLHIDGGTDQLKLSDGSGSFEFRAGNVLMIKDNGTERIRIRTSGQVQFSNGSFSDNVDCIMANGGTMEIGAQSIMKFRTGTNERLRVDSGGRVQVGRSASDSSDSLLIVQGNAGDSGTGGQISIQRGGNANPTAPSDLGGLMFKDSAGSRGAVIAATCDGDWASNDYPTRLEFKITPDNASSPQEKMRISSNGRVSMAHDGSFWNHGLSLMVSASNNGDTHTGRNTNASFSNSLIYYYTSRAGNSAFNFIKLASNAASDTEYKLRGDGQAYADGSWNGGGADYAEYFEWSDGNTSAEDRRGISVVLVDDKIREAVAGEEPIGVISGNPSVVGDTDIDRWKHKYLRDDYGSYVWEDYEVEDEDGNTVVQQRRQINPAWNSENEYVTREDRAEWDTVGLMGKLRIRKGQVTGTRWIKMRDVSDTVEEWLLR
jgi:hypothetical protein